MEYKTLATEEAVHRTASRLTERWIGVEHAANRNQALKKIVEMIPAGAEVMTGCSTTLEEIGFMGMLASGGHPWRDLRAELHRETDAARRADLRRRSVTSEYFVGSFQAIAETGEIVVASASGSQIPSIAYSSRNVIWVAGTQKITPSLEEAIQRVREYALPCEDRRLREAGAAGSRIGKLLIFETEMADSNRKLTVLFVNEVLGF